LKFAFLDFQSRFVKTLSVNFRDFALNCGSYGVLSVGTEFDLIRGVTTEGWPIPPKAISVNFGRTEADSGHRR
jgi:hypothetical protein